MNRAEIIGCFSLMGALWTTYKPPQTDSEIELNVNVWQRFFGGVSSAEVSQALMEISAEGEKYAPMPGEIYKRLKGDRQAKALTQQAISHYRYMAGVYAKIAGIEPPSPAEDPLEWFKEARCREKQ